MVKFAREEKPFDPISNKLLSAIATPPAVLPGAERGGPRPVPPAPAPPEAADGPAEGREEAEAGLAPKEGPKPARARRAKRQVAEKPAPPGRGERLSRAVKCLFTPSEERELRALVGRLAAEAGTSLTLSHLMRPYFDLLLHCEEQLAQELRRADIVRPLNDKTALTYFERQLAEVIHTAFRKTPTLRAERADGEA
jgi:hypothetical protein